MKHDGQSERHPFIAIFDVPLIKSTQMDESSFIRESKPQWERLDAIVQKAFHRGVKSLDSKDLAELGTLYRLASSHLSLAVSRGADEAVVVYLNELVGRAHGLIYTAKRSPAKNVLKFFAVDFPAEFRANIKPILLSAAVFFTGALFAFALVRYDTTAIESLLPAGIGKGLQENVKELPAVKGIPSDLKPILTSFIMTNNIKVSIFAFATGFAFGIPTAYELVINGMMVGALGGFFFGTPSNLDFWALILPHGIIELTAIFIAGGAGFILAGAMIKPGNMRRFDAVRLSAGKAVRLMGGVAAMLVVAAIIEGFITPTGIPPKAKLVFAGFTAVGLAIYLFAGGSAPQQKPSKAK